MTSLLTPETFAFFARFLLAGFVTMSARARFVTGERPKLSETVAEAVILSLVNQFLFRTIFFWLPAAIDGPRETEFLLLAEVLILPGALGLFAGWLVSRNWMPDGARRLILPVTRPVPQAFDHAFAQAGVRSFLIVTYLDGREVYGLFGENSLAGTDSANGGVFIESLYVIDEAGAWSPAFPSRSAWISLKDVRSVEFLEA